MILLCIKTSFPVSDSHYKDKMFVRPSYFHNENPYAAKTPSLYIERRGPDSKAYIICRWKFVYGFWDYRRIYTTSEISVRASDSELGRNQTKWIDVSCFHWSESESEIFVSDVRVSSLHVAISSEADVRVRPRLWNAHAQSRLFTWSPPTLVQNGLGLGWSRIRSSYVV